MVMSKIFFASYTMMQCQEMFLPNIVSIYVIIVCIFKDSFLKISAL